MTQHTAAIVKAPHALLWPLLAAGLILSWSSGFVGIRYANDHAPIFLVLFWRTLMSGLILLPFALLVGPRIGRRALAEQMVYGVLGMFLYLAGFAVAIGQRVPTGLVALIADLVPLAIAALSQPVLGHRLTARQWLGTMIGMAGVVIVSADSLGLGAAPVFAYAFPVAGMLLFAVVTVMQKRLGSIHMPIHQSLAIQCLTAAVFFGIGAQFEGGLMPPMDGQFAFGIGWLVVFSTFFCYSVYYLCLRLYPAAQVSSAVYLSPPVTMIWAWAMFDEPLTAAMFAGLAVTFAGVWLAQGSRSCRETAADHP